MTMPIKIGGVLAVFLVLLLGSSVACVDNAVNAASGTGIVRSVKKACPSVV